MGAIDKLVFIGILVFAYRSMSEEDKKSLAETIKKKFVKYRPKIIEIIDLLEAFNSNPAAIRNEEIDFQSKLSELSKSIEEINDKDFENDLLEIVEFKNKSLKTKETNVNEVKKIAVKKTSAKKNETKKVVTKKPLQKR